MYSTLDYGIGKLRDKEDQYNSIAAAVSTGVIFKSTGWFTRLQEIVTKQFQEVTYGPHYQNSLHQINITELFIVDHFVQETAATSCK